VSPNPALGEVTFAVETPGPARLRIYDLSGQLMRQMSSPGDGSGRIALRWEGRDDAGALVPSGVYFARVQAGARSEVRRFSLIH